MMSGASAISRLKEQPTEREERMGQYRKLMALNVHSGCPGEVWLQWEGALTRITTKYTIAVNANDTLCNRVTKRVQLRYNIIFNFLFLFFETFQLQVILSRFKKKLL